MKSFHRPTSYEALVSLGATKGALSLCIYYVRVYTLYNIETQTHLQHLPTT